MLEVAKPNKAAGRRIDDPTHFEGIVYQQPLLGPGDVALIAVFFEKSARTLPHTHDTDQVLVVVDGTCVVANLVERREVPVGECALVRKGEWHWHGAARGVSACHISIRKPGDTNWDVPKQDWDAW